MQAASRESVATATDRLNRYASDATEGDLIAAGDDLLGVARLLAREPGLRRALADPSRSGDQRAELARSLVGERISSSAADLMGALVEGRWSTTTDLVDAMELLGIEALLAGAERAGNLGEVEDALFRFRQVVASEPQLAATLGDTSASADGRRELIGALLADKVGPVALRLAELPVTGFGGRNLDSALIRLVELAAARRERQLAYVTVAAPLAEQDEDHLAAILTRMYGRQIGVRLSVDPELIGGIRVQVGYDLYDGTILRRLTDARSALVGHR
ncbi:MAG: F0F1 ATP synthase subunit delta [Actinocatenispora sp.]